MKNVAQTLGSSKSRGIYKPCQTLKIEVFWRMVRSFSLLSQSVVAGFVDPLFGWPVLVLIDFWPSFPLQNVMHCSLQLKRRARAGTFWPNMCVCVCVCVCVCMCVGGWVGVGVLILCPLLLPPLEDMGFKHAAKLTQLNLQNGSWRKIALT